MLMFVLMWLCVIVREHLFNSTEKKKKLFSLAFCLLRKQSGRGVILSKYSPSTTNSKYEREKGKYLVDLQKTGVLRQNYVKLTYLSKRIWF